MPIAMMNFVFLSYMYAIKSGIVSTQSGILFLTRGPIHTARGSLSIAVGMMYMNMIHIPMVVPHSASPTIVHESYQLAAPTPTRTGIVSLLDATKKLFMFLLALLRIVRPTDMIATKYATIMSQSIDDHISEKLTAI